MAAGGTPVPVTQLPAGQVGAIASRNFSLMGAISSF